MPPSSLSSDVSTLAERPEISVRYPGWLVSHVEEQRTFIESLDPFPFEQPSDIRPFLSLHQNDYLRLSNHPSVRAARDRANAGSRVESFSSSIFGGASPEHERFVGLARRSLRCGDVLLTTSGWAANVGLVEALATPETPVYLDMEAHASLVDGARLAGAHRLMLRHNDPRNFARRARVHGPGILCIDALYSTDGSIPDLRAYLDVCAEYDCAMILDEAHSWGIFGEDGGGVAVEQGVAEQVHFRTVSLSKALGGHGGMIAGSAEMMRAVCTRMRSVVFSSATSAIHSAAHAAALELILETPERRRHTLEMAALLREHLRAAGVDIGASASQILSVAFRDEDACEFYQRLRDAGILTSVFVYPAVPKGRSLVRYSVYADLDERDVRRIADTTIRVLDEMRYLAGASGDVAHGRVG